MPGARLRWDLGLDDDLLARKRRQNAAELHFRGAVAARGFDVVDAELDRAADGGFEVFLVFLRNLPWIDVLPSELVTHSAAGKDGHLQFGAAEASIFHRRERCY